MITKITGEQPFQVLTNNFSISPSQEGYTLQISADGKQYSNLFTVGAGVTRLVTGVAANSYYRLSGNQSEVSINWMKVCVTEGGGGASGTELSPVSEFPLGAEAGTVVAYSGSSSAAGVYQYDGEEWVPVGVDDLSAYWTSAQTKTYVDSADTALQEQIDTMDEVVSEALVDLNERIVELSGSSVDLSAYWTSAETQSAITAVEDHLFDVEEVTASALTELHNAVLELSANTPDLSAFWTSGETKDYVDTAVSGIDLSNYYTKSETEDVISAATSGKADKTYVDSAITQVQDRIDTMDEVISDALNDLNGELASKVSSSSVAIIWKGTQAEFNAATQSGATADPATLYIIV